MNCRLLSISVFLMSCSQLLAAPAQLVEFHNNGILSWTNALSDGSAYSVEWASKAGGPWYRSWQGPDRTDAGITTKHYINVPMFYRVVENQVQPPPDMEFVEAGSFQMGDPWQDDPFAPSEHFVHSVWIDAFFIDRYEVNERLWSRVYNWAITNGYTDLPLASGQALLANLKQDYMPILEENWYDAIKFCNARSQMEGLQPVYFTFNFFLPGNLYKTGEVDLAISYVDWDANGYRLPTEAEWEKAARGGLQGHHFPWPSYGVGASNFIDGSKANYLNSGDILETAGNGTTPVGWFDGFQPNFSNGVDMANGYGLYDMAGNLPEWCWDYYDNEDYFTNAAAATNPRGPDLGAGVSFRVVRGGGDTASYTLLRCGSRLQFADPGAPSASFRCVRRAP